MLKNGANGWHEEHEDRLNIFTRQKSVKSVKYVDNKKQKK